MSLLKFMPLELMMPSTLLILCHPFSTCLQSFPALGSFPVSQLFASGGQSIRISASATVLPVKIQDWFPLGWTGWISLLSKGLSRVFSNKTFRKHQFFGAQASLWSNCCRKGGPLPGPETGLLSNTRKWIVWGDTCADKARDFIGKGHPGGEQ